MRHLLVLLLSSHAYATDLDKQLHFTASALITTASYQVLKKNEAAEPFVMSMFIGLAAGIAKEMTDKKFDHGDIEADVFGVVTGSVFNLYLEW